MEIYFVVEFRKYQYQNFKFNDENFRARENAFHIRKV